MAFFVTFGIIYTVFILGYGQLTAADDIDNRIAFLETLAANVDYSAHANEIQLEDIKLRADKLDASLENERDFLALLSLFMLVRRVTGPDIGFDARVARPNTQLQDQQTVIFHHIQTNQGAGYNVSNGRFTCPQHGIYQFASTIPSKSNDTIDCEMVMDFVQVGRFHANPPGLDQATQVVVLECQVGQQVWVRQLHGANGTILLGGKREFPSFSGHLCCSFSYLSLVLPFRRAADPNIGFDAQIYGPNVQLSDQETVIFNHIHTNQGAGYNVTNGRFTCPQHGIFQFASTVSSKLGGTLDSEMAMDTIQIGRLQANSPGFDQATQVVVVECRVGQQV
ncbi:uncharacterized protein LOC132561375 [Ylistrum balloti]|uniref:uncharacterized protein LOC132561375 n=1 Tax=Ylistrum balloti TaxID=509963 RepID=UPI002905A5E2|nr:uncharacterized protein LOC132561375 [Ylistrum balloti]